MIIIGFGHERGVGKSTAARLAISFLKQQHPKITCQILSFGESVKDVAYKMYSWAGLEEGLYYENHRSLKEIIIPRLGKSPRQVWEELGFAGRKINRETWSQMAIADLDCDVAFCPDIRHPNEIEQIRIFPGSKVYKINREQREKAKEPGNMDEILAAYTGWDDYIDNNGTLKEFNIKIVKLVKDILILE